MLKRGTHVRQVGLALVKQPSAVRFLPRLAASAGQSPLDLRLPWLPFPLIDKLRERLTRLDAVFEYGGGGSTLFFADRVGKVVTVEHDENWYPILKDATAHLANVKLSFTPADAGFDGYVAAIDHEPDESFDVVVVDGRERVACFTRAIAKVKPGGLLILDDVDRERYGRAFSLVDWPREVFHSLAPYKAMLAHTAVFTKPSEGTLRIR